MWYHDVGFHMGPFDQRSGATSYNIVAMSFPVGKEYTDGGELLTGRLNEITPDGEYANNFESACSAGGATNYTQVTHEAHVDPLSSSEHVLTVRQTVSRVPANATVRFLRRDIDWWMSEEVALWHRTTGELETVYRLSDFLTPWGSPNPEPNSYNLLDVYCANESASLKVLDWGHTSSVTVGPGGDYYVALRNVNAVLRLARDRSGLVWSLSPTVPSNFTFAHEQDAFYDPHVPIAILDGDGRETRLLLIDNGQNRPNCTGAPDACYSRAVEYRLDFDAHVARVSWEFEFPFLLAKATDDEVVGDGLHRARRGRRRRAQGVGAVEGGVGAVAESSAGAAAESGAGAPSATLESPRQGGSGRGGGADGAPMRRYNESFVAAHDLYELAGGDALPLGENRTLVAFTGTWHSSALDYGFQNYTYVFEVDQVSDVVRGSMVVPRPSWNSGSYRVLPLATLAGESPTCPLGEGAAKPRVPRAPSDAGGGGRRARR